MVLANDDLLDIVALTADEEAVCGVVDALAAQVEIFNRSILVVSGDGADAGLEALVVAPYDVNLILRAVLAFGVFVGRGVFYGITMVGVIFYLAGRCCGSVGLLGIGILIIDFFI